MKVSGEITVPAPRETVFSALRNAPFFASCVEGVSGLEEIDATHYKAMLETKIAFMQFKFAVSVEMVHIAPPEQIEVKIEGIPLGVVGRFTSTSVTRLTEADGQTRVSYSTESTLASKLGSIGQPVLKAKAKEMEKKFATNICAAFAPGGAFATQAPRQDVPAPGALERDR
ncbi:MAG: hypothetical protein JSW39_13230 [Desulfobacterales bacterium]|nr:MAG: hypothetical protein JSW39_13230 [Desulfobacterales bacterium]